MLVIFKNNLSGIRSANAAISFSFGVDIEPTPVSYAVFDSGFTVDIAVSVVKSVDCGLSFCFVPEVPVIAKFDQGVGISILLSQNLAGIETFSTATASVHFLFTLTGSENGLDDVEMPIFSFQTRMRSGTPTYLSVVVPGIEHEPDITSRPNGTLKIEMAYKLGGVWLQKETIVQVDFENVELHEGPKSKSLILTGHRTQSFEGKTLTIEKSIYRKLARGKLLHRAAKPNIYLRPGDTVNIGDDTFVAGLITYSIALNNESIAQVMEISEQ